jgi:hypothetical protein
MHEHGWIDTPEGGHIVCPGDYVITGVKEERYPCKPDIFDATYEPVKEGAGRSSNRWQDIGSFEKPGSPTCSRR